MRLLIAIAAVLSGGPQGSISQEGRVPRDGFVGGVVDEAGQIYVLRRDSLQLFNSRDVVPVSIPLDVKSTLADPAFRNVGFHAIALNPKNQPAVLWSGVRQSGAEETYVTFIGLGFSVRLGRPAIIATDLAFGPMDDIFVCGLMRQVPVSLVHHFARDGSYRTSFHPHISANPEDVQAIAKTGRSRVIVIGNAVYVASPFVSNTVFEYSSSGELVRQHDFGAPATGPNRRKFVTIFARGGEALAESVAENQGSFVNEIHRLRDGQLLLSIPARDLAGPVFGILPDGRVVYRNARSRITEGDAVHIQRDSVHIR